jgi:hypothetical protein
VRDWVWGDKDPYDLSKFPGIQAEITRADMKATQLSAQGLYCELIKAAKPGLIVELGVFRGGSSIDAAACIKKLGDDYVKDAFIVAIDTWLNDFCTLPILRCRICSLLLALPPSHFYPCLLLLCVFLP